jgi:hypothetical protein
VEGLPVSNIEVALPRKTASPRTSRLTIARAMTIANSFYWLIFGVLFVLQTYPYQPHELQFEEPSPSYIFFGRALREINSGTGINLPPRLMRVTVAIQKLSFIAARPSYYYFNERGITVDCQYWHISVGGYFLIVVCVLSFVQRYSLGLLLDLLKARIIRQQTTILGV